MLCLAAAATLAAVTWGLKDYGIACVAVMLAGLIGARLLSYVPAASMMSPESRTPR